MGVPKRRMTSADNGAFRQRKEPGRLKAKLHFHKCEYIKMYIFNRL
jgi:hypothetical protein